MGETVLDKKETASINATIVELRKEHRQLRVSLAMNKLAKTSELRRVRKEIARNLTYINQKGALAASKKSNKKK